MSACQNAVVFIVFNRPDCTQQVWDAIRKAQPPRLYVVSDAARIGKPGEAEKVEAVRKIVQQVDWPCEATYDFSEENNGDFGQSFKALDLVFQKEEQIIWLEDDCLPSDSFFGFCDRLLERYALDERIAYIGGSNLLWGRFTPKEDYFLSRYMLPWGLALWKRSYTMIRPNLSYWLDPRCREKVLNNFKTEMEKKFWSHLFDDLYNRCEGPQACERKHAGDYYWKLSFWANDKYALLPSVNLIKNIGFGEGATHTQEMNKSHIVPCKELDFKALHHPKELKLDLAREEWLFRVYCYYEEARPWKRLYNQLKIKGGHWKRLFLNLFKRS
jgi:hypothetical protein